ncbi:hypothetical protein BJ965_001036 [Streptomyces luteogriseus]|uniref:Uncharacterized protein n=1 Tax=Streptomyces luteogriseus TaxID=68233 RepID=A0A7W7GFJ7_9ACTN|nr:hypothetical protein [Streptomyces luteogriseus]MBB4711154.1 hypothetical protein [Streptomyces luteogriseus]
MTSGPALVGSARLVAGRSPGRPSPDRWARMIAARYGLTLAEARAELRRLAAHGWQTWEFHARFDNDRKDDVE